MLLNHLSQEIHILRACGFGLLVHSVFWDEFLMHPTFLILQYQLSECLPFKFTPGSKHILERFRLTLAFQIDEFLLCLSRNFGDILSVHQMV